MSQSEYTTKFLEHINIHGVKSLNMSLLAQVVLFEKMLLEEKIVVLFDNWKSTFGYVSLFTDGEILCR